MYEDVLGVKADGSHVSGAPSPGPGTEWAWKVYRMEGVRTVAKERPRDVNSCVDPLP